MVDEQEPEAVAFGDDEDGEAGDVGEDENARAGALEDGDAVDQEATHFHTVHSGFTASRDFGSTSAS